MNQIHPKLLDDLRSILGRLDDLIDEDPHGRCNEELRDARRYVDRAITLEANTDPGYPYDSPSTQGN